MALPKSDRAIRSIGKRLGTHTGPHIDLFSFKANVYSQGGEDGILAKILELEGLNGYFVEFGAWDGEHLSNCRQLIDKGWHGCFIEGDSVRFNDLVRNTPNHIDVLNRWVGTSGKDSLDAILSGVEVDLLSIDIDGDDLAVWKSVKKFRPKIVIIEYNPTIPSDTVYENPPGLNHGNSMLAIADHAASVGYVLVDGTYTNLIFLRSDAACLPMVVKKDLATIVRQNNHQRYFFGYDGTLIVTGDGTIPEIIPVPWTSPTVAFTQPIPKGLRGFGPNAAVGYSRAWLSYLLAFVSRPISFITKALDRIS